MKKITLTAMVLAVACMFAACTKEGVYNPKEKISKIFESSVSTYTMGSTTTTDETPKHPTESWTWDGKLLSSITYYEGDGTVDETVTFTYDGKQLSKMQTVGSNSYTQFIYDGSKLEKFETYYSNRLESAGTVTYDGKKVVQIDVVDYDNNKSNKTDRLMQTVLQFVMPVYTENTAKVAKTVATKGSNTSTIKFEWDGKNISKAILEYDNDKISVAYTYDEKNNPYQGFLYFIEDEAIGATWGSKNNVLSETVTMSMDGETDTYKYTFSYEYDGKWPTTKTYSNSDSYMGITYSSKTTTYFEYDD